MVKELERISLKKLIPKQDIFLGSEASYVGLRLNCSHLTRLHNHTMTPIRSRFLLDKEGTVNGEKLFHMLPLAKMHSWERWHFYLLQRPRVRA